jgi:hypothetical protein
MTRISCQRLWQVEAARDGRLSGSELSNALRHRSECADCSQATRELDELGRRLKAMRVPHVAPLAHKRTRQALLGAWNAQLLAEPLPRTKLRVVLVAASCAIGSAALALGYPLLRGAARSSESPVVPSKASLAFERSEPEPAVADLSSNAANAPTASVMRREAATPPSSAKRQSRATRPKPALATGPAIDTAEDDAYLQIVDLLHHGREREARARASQYLLQFPHGFRRLEVAKIAER